jgi:hypothetical protein
VVKDPTIKPPPVPPVTGDPPGTRTLTSTQKFNVNAPRFSLPPGVVHQTYPPQGLGDHYNVLPHIIFEDPHLPWERDASQVDDKEEIDQATPPTSGTTLTSTPAARASSGSGPTGAPSSKTPTLSPSTTALRKPQHGRNLVPWLALLTFTEDQLKLTPDQLKARSAGGFFPEGDPEVPSKSTTTPKGLHEQDRSTFAVKLTMNE